MKRFSNFSYIILLLEKFKLMFRFELQKHSNTTYPGMFEKGMVSPSLYPKYFLKSDENIQMFTV